MCKTGNPDKYYNSACFVAPSAEVLATYQKHFLYETDESWAEEGPGFMSIDVPSLGKVTTFLLSSIIVRHKKTGKEEAKKYTGEGAHKFLT
jgi:protein N-terminal amidase